MHEDIEQYGSIFFIEYIQIATIKQHEPMYVINNKTLTRKE